MLTMTGVLRAAQQIGGGTNRATGEVVPVRSVLQIEGLDDRGLVTLHTLYVPELGPYEGAVGSEVSVPVKAWAKGAQVQFSYLAQ